MANQSSREHLETRVLLLAPTRRDGEITAALLTDNGLDCWSCDDLTCLAGELARGAGAVLLTEDVVGSEGLDVFLASLEAQPPWSDIPVVMLMHGGGTAPGAAKTLNALRNVMLLERPAPMRSLVSAVQAAVRARQRQYEIRDHIQAIRLGQEERQHLLESERAARQEAERVGRAKDEFLATLSHELRTPLNAIFGWAQLMKMCPDDHAALVEGIDVIDRNIRLQTQLIDDLLDMSRIISGKVRLELQRVDLLEVVDAAVESMRPSIAAKDIRLEKVLEPAVGAISGDPARLQQVFWNLLTNAVKFTPQGGRIKVVLERVDSHASISVSDTGEGIAPEFLPRLFERFTQADASTTRQHGGLGLGLSIVRNLVEMHGGTIQAQSAGKGQGATFIVRLPLRALEEHERFAPARRLDGAAQVLRDPARLKGIKVLVVDDEPDARELVRRLLTECGAEPALASSAGEARLLVESFAPHVIVSDIGMPAEDGYQFMRGVRHGGLKTPAVALTAFARQDDRIRSLEAGYQAHLPKPVEPSELLAVVASLAGRYDPADGA